MGYKFISFTSRKGFGCLFSADAINYEKLRDALLNRYQLTEVGFRQKFCTSQQETGDTASQILSLD